MAKQRILRQSWYRGDLDKLIDAVETELQILYPKKIISVSYFNVPNWNYTCGSPENNVHAIIVYED